MSDSIWLLQGADLFAEYAAGGRVADHSRCHQLWVVSESLISITDPSGTQEERM